MNKKITKAVITAAGLGTRFFPITKIQPKEMLPIVDKPVLHFVVEEATQAGIKDILIITSSRKGVIKDYFSHDTELENELIKKGKQKNIDELKKIESLANITYVDQKEMLGLGNAVSYAKDFVKNEPFVLLLGDSIMHGGRNCTKQLIETYEKYNSPVIGVEKVPQHEVDRYGILDVQEIEKDVFLVNDLVEKPTIDTAPSDIAIAGRYVLTQDIFSCIEDTQKGIGGEIQITDSLKLLNKKNKIHACLYEAKRYDIGDREDYVKAIIKFSLERADIKEGIKEYIKGLKI
jgi:UTP--glucose-1-phosphate uridylyltransferase